MTSTQHRRRGPSYVPLPRIVPSYTYTAEDDTTAPRTDYPTYAPPVFDVDPALEQETVSPRPTYAATRPRLVTGTPGEANPLNPTERLQQLMSQGVVDVNGRGMSALAMAGQPVRPSDSLGNLIGQRLSNALMGLLNPAADEQIAHNRDIARQAGISKMSQESEQNEAELELKRAQAANQRDMPTYRDTEQRRKEEADRARALDQRRRAVASVINDLEEFDPDDPGNARTVADLRELGLPVIAKKKGEKATYKQDARTGAWYVLRGDQSAPVNAPGGNGQLTTTTPQAMNQETQAAARESRERIARWRIEAQKEIAAQSAAIQRDRVQMSRDQFSQRYPGAGKTISSDAVVQKAKALNMLPEDVAKEAVRQGYTIQD